MGQFQAVLTPSRQTKCFRSREFYLSLDILNKIYPYQTSY